MDNIEIECVDINENKKDIEEFKKEIHANEMDVHDEMYDNNKVDEEIQKLNMKNEQMDCEKMCYNSKPEKEEIKEENSVCSDKENAKEVCEKITADTNATRKKVAMSTSIDNEAVRAAYDEVRSDSTDTQWAVFKFEGSKIVCAGVGVQFDDFRGQFRENERGFGYIRIQAGDEMSKRQKFLFVTWVGSGVSVIQRAKMSTDKSVMKNIISNFAVELQLESLAEFDLPFFIESLNKASGANYGTGIREI